MARSARRADTSSLDSLLDTMANVVGILVVLVAVTQLSLGDAVERIRASAGERAAATPDDLAELVGEREDVRDEIELARAKLERFATEQTAGLRLADARPLLDEFESLAGPSAAAGDVPTLEEREQLRVEVARLEGEVTRAEGEREKLLAILAEPVADDAPLTIRLPDPRPVPAGLQRVFFFCRGGEVHFVDLDALGDALYAGMRDATGSVRETMLIEPSDVPWVVNHFKKEEIGDQGYRWVFDRELNAELVPTAAVAAGEGDGALTPSSRFAAALDALNPRRQYVRFFVWPDGFDVYLTARRMAEQRGLRIGWQEVERDRNLRFNVFDRGDPSRNLLD